MIIERKLSKWESRNFTRVRKLSPKETQRFYSQLYEQRQYAMGLGFLSKGLGKISKSAGNLNTKINNAGGTGGVFKNIGSNIKTGFENTGTKIKNWWNSGPNAYETSSMYNARMRSGVGPQQAQTKEYKSIFTPKQQPEKITLNVSAEKKNAFNSPTDGIIKSADDATNIATNKDIATNKELKPEPQNINSGGATDQSVMKKDVATPTNSSGTGSSQAISSSMYTPLSIGGTPNPSNGMSFVYNSPTISNAKQGPQFNNSSIAPTIQYNYQ